MRAIEIGYRSMVGSQHTWISIVQDCYDNCLGSDCGPELSSTWIVHKRVGKK